MAIRLLTVSEHRDVLAALVSLGQSVDTYPVHRAGLGFTSLLVCFHLNQLAGARSILALASEFDLGWFPVGPGYAIARSLFETDINAHYIAADPASRSRRYIDFVHVLNKREMDACSRHRSSPVPSWKASLEATWLQKWSEREAKVNADFDAVAAQFRLGTKVCRSWSGKSLREMAVEVKHEEAYDVFYAYLSSFAHADIRLADRYLRADESGPVWTGRAEEYHVGNVFRHAASFLTCFLELVAREFGVWDVGAPERCWDGKRA
jgi:hypothetical protein